MALGILRAICVELETQCPFNYGIRQMHQLCRSATGQNTYVKEQNKDINLFTKYNYKNCFECVQNFSVIATNKKEALDAISNNQHRTKILEHLVLGTDNIVRHYANKPQQQRKDVIEHTEEKKFSELTLGEKVTQTGKDVSYLAVIVVGVGITLVMFYTIGREVFSSQSPSGVYGQALKICRNNVQVIDAVGEPIKGYGEMSSRGRRRHVSHTVFERNGIQHMVMKFYIEGPREKGTVHLEVKKNDAGKFEYEYLIVALDTYSKRNIIIEDNRNRNILHQV